LQFVKAGRIEPAWQVNPMITHDSPVLYKVGTSMIV